MVDCCMCFMFDFLFFLKTNVNVYKEKHDRIFANNNGETEKN